MLDVKRGDILQHRDGSIYVVQDFDKGRNALKLGTVYETTELSTDSEGWCWLGIGHTTKVIGHAEDLDVV